MPGCRRAWRARACSGPAAPFLPVVGLLPPSPSPLLRPSGAGEGRPRRAPRMSRARLPVDLPVSVLTALRVRGCSAAGTRSSGGAEQVRVRGSASGGVRGTSGRGPSGLARRPPRPTGAGVPGETSREPRPPPPGAEPRIASFRLRPQIRRDDPLNLSILLSGGKETNQDSLSSGERRGKSPAPNPRPTGGRGKCGVRKTACPVSLGGLSPSDRGSARGRCEAGNGPRRAGVRSSRSRVVWECSPKRVVNSI